MCTPCSPSPDARPHSGERGKCSASAALCRAELTRAPFHGRAGCALTDLTLADLQSLHELFAPDVMAVWDFEAAVERRDATGGTSKRSVLEQAAKLEAWANAATAGS